MRLCLLEMITLQPQKRHSSAQNGKCTYTDKGSLDDAALSSNFG